MLQALTVEEEYDARRQSYEDSLYLQELTLETLNAASERQIRAPLPALRRMFATIAKARSVFEKKRRGPWPIPPYPCFGRIWIIGPVFGRFEWMSL